MVSSYGMGYLHQLGSPAPILDLHQLLKNLKLEKDKEGIDVQGDGAFLPKLTLGMMESCFPKDVHRKQGIKSLFFFACLQNFYFSN